MFCKNCGNEIDNNAYVCPKCGVRTQSGAPEKRNTLALLGFIFAFLVPIAGLILSILGHKKASEFDDDRKGLAKAGIIISVVFMALNLVLGVINSIILVSALA